MSTATAACQTSPDAEAIKVYESLRRNGEVPCDAALVPSVRRLAKRDGHHFSRSTTRDYMGRASVHVSIHDGNGNLVFPAASEVGDQS